MIPPTDSNPRGQGWRPQANQQNQSTQTSRSASSYDSDNQGEINVPERPQRSDSNKGLRVLLNFLLLITTGIALFALYAAFSEESEEPLPVFAICTIISIVLFIIRKRTKLVHQKFAIIGYVKNIKERSEKKGINDTLTIMTFHVERFDQQGNRIAPIPVEMKGMSFSGSINEGDHVGIDTHFREGKILQVKKLHNLTNKSLVLTKGTTMPFYLRIANAMGWLLWFIIMIGIFALIFAVISNIN